MTVTSVVYEVCLSSMKEHFLYRDFVLFVQLWGCSRSVFGLFPIFVYCCTGLALCLTLDSFCRGWFFSTAELASVCSLVRSSFLLLLFSESVQVSILSSGKSASRFLSSESWFLLLAPPTAGFSLLARFSSFCFQVRPGAGLFFVRQKASFPRCRLVGSRPSFGVAIVDLN
jgi:hypothetical protein